MQADWVLNHGGFPHLTLALDAFWGSFLLAISPKSKSLLCRFDAVAAVVRFLNEQTINTAYLQVIFKLFSSTLD